MHLKSSTMVGENFENYLPEMSKMHLKSSTMVGEKFENFFLGIQENDTPILLNTTLNAGCAGKWTA